jgi:hypothetical protein
MLHIYDKAPAEVLVDWLNSKKRGPDHGRIERLLLNLQILNQVFGGDITAKEFSAANPKLRGLFWNVKDIAQIMGREFNRALRAVRSELRRHQFSPDLNVFIGKQSAHQGNSLQFKWRTENSASAKAVLNIVLLGHARLLAHVRKCLACKRWYYAKFGHQNFCTLACQQRHYKSSSAWREHRREYMRKFRESQRNRR